MNPTEGFATMSSIIHVQRYNRDVPFQFQLQLEHPAWVKFDIAGLSPAEIKSMLMTTFNTLCKLREVKCSARYAVAYGDADVTVSCNLSGYFLISETFPKCQWLIYTKTNSMSFQLLGLPHNDDFRSVLYDGPLNLRGKVFLFYNVDKKGFANIDYVIMYPGKYLLVKPFANKPYECWSASKKQKQD